MKFFTAVFTIIAFAANLFVSVADAVVLCAHDDGMHIVLSSEHARSHSDMPSFAVSSECSDVVFEAFTSPMQKTSQLKLPSPSLREILPFACLFSQFEIGAKEKFSPIFVRLKIPPNPNLDSFVSPLLI